MKKRTLQGGLTEENCFGISFIAFNFELRPCLGVSYTLVSVILLNLPVGFLVGWPVFSVKVSRFRQALYDFLCALAFNFNFNNVFHIGCMTVNMPLGPKSAMLTCRHAKLLVVHTCYNGK